MKQNINAIDIASVVNGVTSNSSSEDRELLVFSVLAGLRDNKNLLDLEDKCLWDACYEAMSKATEAYHGTGKENLDLLGFALFGMFIPKAEELRELAVALEPIVSQCLAGVELEAIAGLALRFTNAKLTTEQFLTTICMEAAKVQMDADSCLSDFVSRRRKEIFRHLNEEPEDWMNKGKKKSISVKKSDPANKNLIKAKEAKQDEFYTNYFDVAAEVKHYEALFREKVVYCNCDDPSFSNYFKFFYLNFHRLGLKKLISSFYSTSGAHVTVYEGDGANLEIIPLHGQGSYDDLEVKPYLQEADIVCTNPPFSIWRGFLQYLLDNKKKYLILGGAMASTNQGFMIEMLKHRAWIGYEGGSLLFEVPETYEPEYEILDSKGMKHYAKGVNVYWFENLVEPVRAPLKLNRGVDNPRYLDGTNILEFQSYADIPAYAKGVIAVPISVLGHLDYCQFRLIGSSSAYRLNDDEPIRSLRLTIDDKEIFERVLLQRIPGSTDGWD